MDLIEWDESLSVHVTEIDQQHKELVRVLNHLADAIQAKKGNETLKRTLEVLINYAEHHFKTEEKYFAQFNYPDADSHKEEHLTFALKILDYQDKLYNVDSSLSTEVLIFLWDWLKQHIKETDKKYSQFFNDKGLK